MSFWVSSKKKRGATLAFKALIFILACLTTSGEVAAYSRDYLPGETRSASVFGNSVSGGWPGGSMAVIRFRPTQGELVDTLTIGINRDGSPTDNVYVELYLDDGSSTLGSFLDVSGNSVSGTIMNENSTSTADYYDFSFAPRIEFVPGTDYNIVLRRDGTPDSSNRYSLLGVANEVQDDPENSYSGTNFAANPLSNFSQDRIFSTENGFYESLEDTRTRFIDIQPAGGSTIATSTIFTVQYYINIDDYNEDIFFNLSFNNDTVSNLGGFAFDAWRSATGNGGIEIHGESLPGVNTFDVEMEFPYTGKTRLDMTMRRDTLLSGFPLIGDYFSPNQLAATTTEFIIVQKSSLDLLAEQREQNLLEYFTTGTTTPGAFDIECNPLDDFDIINCVVSLFVPPPFVLQQDFDRIKSDLLFRAPWGYASRFAEIMSGNATSTATTTGSLTAFTVPIFTGASTTEELSFDMQEAFTGGAALLDSIRDPIHEKNTRDVTEPIVQLIVAMSALFIVVKDVLAMGHNKT